MITSGLTAATTGAQGLRRRDEPAFGAFARHPPADDGHDAAAAAVLDLMRIAVVLVQGDGKVILSNRAADAVLACGDGLTLSAGRLRARDGAVARQLARLLSDGQTEGRLDGVVSVPRQSGPPLAVLVVPLGGRQPVSTRAVFLCDRSRGLEPSDQLHVELYGLTHAEARVARLVVQGLRPRQAALELGVGVATVRAHLKQVFAKTETRSQSDLVRVLLSGPSLLATA
jgi:DNA-binding CsgD family transcriptional regulator